MAIIAPLTGLAFARQLERRTFEIRRLEEQARARVVQVALALGSQFDDTRILLDALSRLIDLDQPRAAVDGRLAQLIVAATPRYADLWISDTRGQRIGSAARQPNARVGSIADRRYFQDALRLQRFTVGDVLESRTTPGRLILSFAAPILDPTTGAVRALVGATWFADSLDRILGVDRLPPGSVVTLVDSTGRVQYRSLDRREWIGRSLAGTEGFASNRAIPSGVDTTLSADGTRRMVAFETLAGSQWIVYVGIPISETLDVVRRQFRQDLAVTIAAALVLLLVGNLLVNQVVTPVESLTRDAMAIAAGDTGRRSATAGPGEIGSLAHAFNAMADRVEERSRALEDSASRYRFLFDSNPVPVFGWDLATQRILIANQASATTFGRDRDALVGMDVTQLLPPGEGARFIERMRTGTGEARDDGYWSFVTADGRVVEGQVLSAPYHQAAGAAVLHVVVDVTARRAAERALDESREEERHRQRLESLGSFAAGIAHDFNNYLASIVGFAGLLRERFGADAEAASDIEQILGAAKRAADLTRQILVFSRRQVNAPTPQNVGLVIKALRPMVSRLLGEQVHVATYIGDHGVWTMIDPSQLEQAVMNLATNARDAMPGGGRFTLSTRVTTEGPGGNDDAERGTGRWVVLDAVDTGPGIPEAIRDRVFDPFFTTKARGSGTGLGLAVVFGVVRQVGGSVRIMDTSGGAHLALYFPVTVGGDVRGESDGDGAGVRGGTEHVLLVEDEGSVRTALERMLSSVGYRVTTASNAAEAIAAVARSETPIQLLLTDLEMPGANGRELAETLRASHPGLRVLYTSGYSDDDTVMTQGLAFLPKPATREAVLRAVRDILDASSGHHDHAGRTR
ncbi:MAG: response regulator [Gemmatimonadetes bacterium]|nr:response regulator [Gemmatimonadota bacterium]